MARINAFDSLGPRRPAASPMDRIAGMVGALWLWQFRARSRARLSLLDDHLLNDIGLDRAERDREIAKPFWQS